MRILILEDDINRIRIFKQKLKDQIVDITDDANKAIQYLKTNIYDFCFLDHDLGGLQMQWDEQNCGMVVAKYLSNLEKPLLDMGCIVHSYNNVRGPIMVQQLCKAGYKANYQPGA